VRFRLLQHPSPPLRRRFPFRRQFRERRFTFPEDGWRHVELAHHFGICARSDNISRLLKHVVVSNAGSVELIGKHKPERRVFLIRGLVGGGKRGFQLAYDNFRREWRAENRSNRRLEIKG
jgi:hypothetical protein